MGYKQAIRFMVFLTVFCVYASMAGSIELKGGVEILEDYRNQKNYKRTDTVETRFDVDTACNIFSLYPSLTLSFNPRIKATLIADLTCFSSIYGEEDEDETGLSMTTASMVMQTGNLTIEGGLLPVNMGNSYLFSGDEPALRISGRISSRNRITIQSALIYHHSPFITAQLEYRMAFLETVKLFGAFFMDKDDTMAPLSDLIASNTASIFWIGGEGEFFIGRAFLSCMAMTQTGTISLDPDENATGLISPNPGRRWYDKEKKYDIDLSGYLIDCDLSVNLTEWLTLSSLFFMASGDRTTLDANFEGFVSLTPSVLKLPVFFEGAGDILSDDRMTIYGVDRQGVVAPGVKIGITPEDRITLNFSFSWLYAKETRSSSEACYGWEMDTAFLFEWKKQKAFFTEAGVFYPGSYFDASGIETEWVGKIRAGLHLVF